MARPIDPRVVEINSRIFANRLQLTQVLSRAKVGRSVWWRWEKLGVEPRQAVLGRLNDAINDLISEKD